ncbi:CBS domain-containing putative transcriptional regulator (plasmid) [Desulfocapsa sulfexigens DSM 10523]|uniref:CBS domain-containing putative transcriptional regulator n=1 Tax=Desulfocapsa sulfexigens (strain DSM 10523 / SB164P1) TaxID=1167006 RepID=M1P9I1_DESSD|nr:helix-turn-helix transcriptional regulator [Desulfocapsa sulfexigens]AGF80113.1 CBS domain-containing putative transcriptional regulator [Desulfocapsa sulfexigens DSM 10523]
MKPEEVYGKVLKEIRNARGISQEKLALMGNLDRTFISLLERGLRQPSLTSILQIAEALNEQPHIMIKKVKDILDENIED